MDQQELLTVEHAYFLSRPGVQMLVLSPKLSMSENWQEQGWSVREERVTVVRPDGSTLPAMAQIRMTHLNISDPMVSPEARWPVTVCLTDRTDVEVPVGSRILVSPEVWSSILGGGRPVE